MTLPDGPEGPHPVLQRLTTELHRRGWPAQLVRPPDRNPHVLAHGGAPASICERVFATEAGALYIPGIRPALAAQGNVRTAADRVIWILRARARHEQAAVFRPGLDDLTALQRALARHGHHGEVIIPPPRLCLPPTGDGPSSEIHTHLLGFRWAGLDVGDRTHIPTAAQTIAWALDADSAAPPRPPSPPARDVTP
jgi:hypothetical protein